jgi:hypothetical protein
MESKPKFIIEASQHCPTVADEGSIFKVMVDGIHDEHDALPNDSHIEYYGFIRENNKWIFTGKALKP